MHNRSVDVIDDDLSSSSMTSMVYLVRYVLAPIYLLLFTIGIVGNLCVIAVVVHIFCTLNSAKALANRHVYVYILSLSVVDALVLCTIPLVATDMIVGSWIFGQLLCRCTYALESINKVLSTFILTAVSWDRCMAICWPFRRSMHRTRVAVGIVGMCALVAGVLLLPIHLNAVVIDPNADQHPTNYTLNNNSMVHLNRADSRVLKCYSNLGDAQLRLFMSYIFVFGYCVPAILMTVFYTAMLVRLMCHRRRLQTHSAVPLRRVTLSILMVVAMYYIVWTPYWIMTIWFVIIGRPPNLSRVGIFAMYIIHALPYAGSAFNCVFYALLNKQLRESHSLSLEIRRQSQVSRCSDINTMAIGGVGACTTTFPLISTTPTANTLELYSRPNSRQQNYS